MLKKTMVISLLMLFVLGVSAYAIAAPGGYFRGGMRQQETDNQSFVPPITQLELSEDQYAKLREIENAFFKKISTLREQKASKILELRNLMLQKNPDEKAVSAKQEEINAVMDKMSQLRQSKFDDINKILTKEQLEKLESLRGPRAGQGQGIGLGKGRSNGAGQGNRGGMGFGCGLMGGF